MRWSSAVVFLVLCCDKMTFNRWWAAQRGLRSHIYILLYVGVIYVCTYIYQTKV